MLAACLPFAGARAGDSAHWIEEDRFKLSLGSFITDFDSEFKLSSDRINRGTEISFEDDLGLDDSSTVIRLDGHYRFSSRHRINFSYFDLSRDGDTISTRPLIIDDTLFRRGSELSTEFDYQILKLAYAYSFWQTDKVDLSVSGGLYTFDIDISVKSEDGKQEGDAGTAPFPMFGVHLGYRLRESLYLNAGFEYFAVNESDVEGELTDALVSLEYRAFENVGFGLGYNAVGIFVESTEDDDDKFDFEYDGILLYLTWIH